MEARWKYKLYLEREPALLPLLLSLTPSRAAASACSGSGGDHSCPYCCSTSRMQTSVGWTSANPIWISHSQHTLTSVFQREPRFTWLFSRNVPLYSFLYSGKCSPHTTYETFTNNSHISSLKEILSNMPSERYIPALVLNPQI